MTMDGQAAFSCIVAAVVLALFGLWHYVTPVILIAAVFALGDIANAIRE